MTLESILVQFDKPPYNERDLEETPEAVCYYGEMSLDFIMAIREKTGLEDYELQDYIDNLMVRLFEPWPIAGWINMIYQDWADSNARHAKFRNYVLIVMAVMVVAPIIITAMQATSAALAATEVKTLSLLSKIKLGVSVFTGSIATSFKAFLTAIHFKTLVGIHKIAYLVSDDYRATIYQVYSEISRVSEALGFGPHFLVLALQNTRNLVLDVSTSLGMRYDMAEIQWLSTFQGYLKNFSGASYKYRNNPEALFFDLSRWVEKDALDRKGMFIEGIVTALDKTIESVADAVNQTVAIRDSLSELIKDLPDSIRKQIEPALMPYIQQFDTFISEKYNPYKQELDGIISVIQSLQGTQKLKMAVMIDRLKRPGDYLSEINKFEGYDRLSQERQVADIASSELLRDSNMAESYASELSAELDKIRLALEHISIESLAMPIEVNAPSRPAGVPAKIRETWNVGDY